MTTKEAVGIGILLGLLTLCVLALFLIERVGRGSSKDATKTKDPARTPHPPEASSAGTPSHAPPLAAGAPSGCSATPSPSTLRPSPTPADLETFSRTRLLVGAGGAALAIAPFFPWARVVLLGDLDLLDLGQMTSSTGWVWTLILLGVGATGFAVMAQDPRSLRGVAWVGGLTALCGSGYLFLGLTAEVQDAQGFARVGSGPAIAIAGSLAIIGGAWSSGKATLPSDIGTDA